MPGYSHMNGIDPFLDDLESQAQQDIFHRILVIILPAQLLQVMML